MPSPVAVPQWFLAQTRPNAEKVACLNLERQGFATFRPLERYTSVRAGRFLTRVRSFFPGYVFVGLPTGAARWSLVNSTLGVSRLIAFAGKPARVHQHVIDDLRAHCDANGTITLRDDLTRGSEVEIRQGSFAGFTGRIERLTPDERALVLIDFLGKDTRVDLAREALTCRSGD
ncbi:MAG: transcriptional activator RfaH [Parvularcula sp.]|jgi:transcriptional antiterminator RfaH|nr:transcriptional activator RfaH [Parvularcula sp.]